MNYLFLQNRDSYSTKNLIFTEPAVNLTQLCKINIRAKSFLRDILSVAKHQYELTHLI